MNEGFQKFAELARTDSQFQQKLKAAIEAYSGEMTEEAVFNNVLVPLANEYGIFGTFEEFRAYTESLANQPMSKDELTQIAGGKAGGLGITACLGVGLGGGGGGSSSTEDSAGSVGACFGFGIGVNGFACFGKGIGSEL
jgi:hypothetical protein